MMVSFSGYEQCWRTQGELFIPRIMPSGGNVLAYPIDCASKASLKWPLPDPAVGYILWELVTDLFDHAEPEEPAILAFELAIQHLVTTVLPHYQTFGVLLYKGRPPLSPTLMRSLAAHLPDHVTPLIALDVSHEQGLSWLAHVPREAFPHIGWILKGHAWPYAWPAIGWDQPSPLGYYAQRPQSLLPQRRIPLALCYGSQIPQEMPHEVCRLIPEALLTEEWEGVDHLLTLSLSPLGQRKLRGFLAAGGTYEDIPITRAIDQGVRGSAHRRCANA